MYRKREEAQTDETRKDAARLLLLLLLLLPLAVMMLNYDYFIQILFISDLVRFVIPPFLFFFAAAAAVAVAVALLGYDMSDEERRGEERGSALRFARRVMDWLVWNVEKCELPTAARIIIPLLSFYSLCVCVCICMAVVLVAQQQQNADPILLVNSRLMPLPAAFIYIYIYIFLWAVVVLNQLVAGINAARSHSWLLYFSFVFFVVDL